MNYEVDNAQIYLFGPTLLWNLLKTTTLLFYLALPGYLAPESTIYSVILDSYYASKGYPAVLNYVCTFFSAISGSFSNFSGHCMPGWPKITTNMFLCVYFSCFWDAYSLPWFSFLPLFTSNLTAGPEEPRGQVIMNIVWASLLLFCDYPIRHNIYPQWGETIFATNFNLLFFSVSSFSVTLWIRA